MQGLERLQLSVIAVKLVTNSTQKSKLEWAAQKLTGLGFDMKYNEMFTSLTATRKLVETKCLHPFCLLQDDAMEDFAELDMTNPNAVIVGLIPDYFTYKHASQPSIQVINRQ